MEAFEKMIDDLRDEQYNIVVDDNLSPKERLHTLQSWRAVYVNRLHLAALHNVPNKVDGFSRLISHADALIAVILKENPDLPLLENEDAFSARVAKLRGKMYHIFDEPNRPIEEYITEMSACGICYLALSAEAASSEEEENIEINALRPDVCAYLEVVDAMLEAAVASQN